MAKTKQEAEWEAESDAGVLASAEEIMHDAARLKAAKTAAAKLAKETSDKARYLVGVTQRSVKNGARAKKSSTSNKSKVASKSRSKPASKGKTSKPKSSDALDISSRFYRS